MSLLSFPSFLCSLLFTSLNLFSQSTPTLSFILLYIPSHSTPLHPAPPPSSLSYYSRSLSFPYAFLPPPSRFPLPWPPDAPLGRGCLYATRALIPREADQLRAADANCDTPSSVRSPAGERTLAAFPFIFTSLYIPSPHSSYSSTVVLVPISLLHLPLRFPSAPFRFLLHLPPDAPLGRGRLYATQALIPREADDLRLRPGYARRA